MTVTLPNATYAQPGRLLAYTADIFGVEVSDLLTGHAPSARAWAVHQLATHFPAWPRARIAATVCLTDVTYILSRRPPSPVGAVRPPDTGMCTVQCCTRAHRAGGLRMCAGHMARWRRNATLDVDRTLRSVNVNTPVLDVESHGWRAYRQGCRCRPCTDASPNPRAARHVHDPRVAEDADRCMCRRPVEPRTVGSVVAGRRSSHAGY